MVTSFLRCDHLKFIMKVPLLDLKLQYKTIKEEILKVTQDIFESQYFILGPHVETLEKDIASYCGTKHAVGVSSGSDALIISLMAAGIGDGDFVLTTPYTFFATAGSICRVGAKPIFADIDAKTCNIDPESIRRVIDTLSAREKAGLKGIIPVHLYGQSADMSPVLDAAKAYNLVVIEDAAQAIGAEYEKKRAGSMGDFGCFSFFPSKNLGAFGDGGMVTTDSDEFDHNLKILRNHGAEPKYYHKIAGGNFRLDALQAAIVSVKLKHLDSWTKGRRKNALKYRELIIAAGIGELVILPEERETRHIYNQFVISLTEKRNELRLFLQESGIGTEIYYPVPLHLQECFRDLGYKKGDFPASEYAAEHTLALPVYSELSDDQMEYVVDKISAFYM